MIVRGRAPIIEGLLAASVDAPNATIRGLLLSVREELLCGSRFQEAVAAHASFFPACYVDLVRAGEESGDLAGALEEIEEHLIGDYEFAIEMNEHLFYISALLFVIPTLGLSMFTFVVPVFGEIYGSFNVTPTSPLFVLLRNIPQSVFTPFVLLIYALLIYLLYWRLRASVGGPSSGLAARIVCNLPVIGQVVKKNDCHTVLSTLSRLLQCGAPIDVAMACAAATDVYPPIRSAVERARQRVLAGESLEQAFAQEHDLPRGLRELSGINKAGSLLPAVLGRLAQQYRREASRAARIAMHIACPVAICLIGAMVFVIYGGLFEAVNGLSGVFLDNLSKD